MRSSIIRITGAFCLALGLSLSSAWAQSNVKEGGKEKQEAAEAPEEKLSETTHSITIDGKRIEYNVIAGTMALTEDAEDPKPRRNHAQRRDDQDYQHKQKVAAGIELAAS